MIEQLLLGVYSDKSTIHVLEIILIVSQKADLEKLIFVEIEEVL